jgi:D-inositol-3-phosphate glycosyltransferase
MVARGGPSASEKPGLRRSRPLYAEGGDVTGRAMDRRCPSILIVGQYVPSTGLTSVVQNLARRLNRDDSVSILGLAYKGPAVWDGANVYPDAFDFETGVWTGLKTLARTIKPDVVLLCNELSTQAGLLTHVARLALHAKVICYTAVEGAVVDEEMMAILGAADCCVFFSEFAREQAARCIPRSKLRVIPHGVDIDTFRPQGGPKTCDSEVDRRRAARRTLFPERPELLDSFIVLNANRPWRRKRIDITVEGFAMFAKGKPPGVKLYLHHARASEFERQSTQELLELFRVEDRVILGGAAHEEPPLSMEQLNLLYNACDVGLNTAMGEGWGLVSFEHAATGAAQIVPGYGTCAEVWRGAAVPLESEGEDVFLFAGHYSMNTVSAEQVAAKLESLYVDAEYRREIATAGYRNATRPEYRWSNIAEQWDGLFQTILGG